MGRSFSFALIAGTIFTVVIVINIIASSNLKTMDDGTDDHMHTGGGTAQPNIVLFIGSGLGPAGVTLARGFQAALRKGDAAPPASLSFEPYLTATLRTRSSDSIVTDAAAAASALATGKKTANGMAAVDPQTKASVLSVFEKAKKAGFKTGFVTTGELAGPVAAAFTSHMEHANMAEMVVSQQLTAKFDLLLGGGAKAYTNTTAWTGAAYDVLKTAQDLEKASKLPVLGVFADSKLRFEIDTKTAADQPSLHKMTKKALDLLHNDKGFFLVVQAANIEACAQVHDAACLAREVLALQEAYEAVAELVAKKNTVCLIASDRDVGGPALVDDKLAILTPLAYSTDALAAGILKAVPSPNAALVNEVIKNLTGINLDSEEGSYIASANEDEFASAVGDVLAKRAGLVWSSAYNTAGDVNLYTCGDATKDVPRGNVDNTVVGDYLMKKLTSSMHAASPSPMAHSGGHHH